MRTRPPAGCKAQFLELVTAGGTCLRRRKEGADLCKDSVFMLRLVFALAHEFSPSCIGNRLCEMVILHHALNFQSLENQRLVIVHQSSRCLVKEATCFRGTQAAWLVRRNYYASLQIGYLQEESP